MLMFCLVLRYAAWAPQLGSLSFSPANLDWVAGSHIGRYITDSPVCNCELIFILYRLPSQIARWISEIFRWENFTLLPGEYWRMHWTKWGRVQQYDVTLLWVWNKGLDRVQYSTVQYSTVQYSRSDPDTQTDWQSFHFPDNKLTEFGSLVIIVKI